jgi:hypothetical protein
MNKQELRQLIKEEVTQYIGKRIDHPAVVSASEEAAKQSGFSSNNHYIFKKGFLKGVEWLENKNKTKTTNQ